MNGRIALVTASFAALALAATAAAAADKVAREDLGRSVKLRILVDKVMQPVEGWVTKEWIVKEAAEAGFNVFSPRTGYERLAEVRQVAQWCKQHGIPEVARAKGDP